MIFEPQKGDQHCYAKNSPNKLSWSMTGNSSFHWLPSQGKPASVLEWVLQKLIKLIAWFPIYIVLVLTILLLLQIYVLAPLF
jgi:hypothetical protein